VSIIFYYYIQGYAVGKKHQANVRDHLQEKEYLLKLGQGDLVSGVHQIVKELAHTQNVAKLDVAKSNLRRK